MFSAKISLFCNGSDGHTYGGQQLESATIQKAHSILSAEYSIHMKTQQSIYQRKAVDDSYTRRRDEAAEENYNKLVRTMPLPGPSSTYDWGFKAGADWCRGEWHNLAEVQEKLRIAIEALEKCVSVAHGYDYRPEGFGLVNDIAKEALELIKK